MENKFWREIKSWVVVILIALGLKATVIEAYQIPTGSMEKTILIGDFILGNRFIYGIRTPDWIGIPYTDIGFGIPYFRLPGFKKPNSGEVVIFKFPQNLRQNYIKRCIATGGQTVEIIRKQVYVDGVEMSFPENGQFLSDNILPPSAIDPQIFPRGNGNKDNYGKLYIPKKGDILTLENTHPDVIRNVGTLSGHSVGIRNGTIYLDGSPAEGYTVEQNFYFMMGDNRDNSFDSRYWGLVSDDLILGRALFIYFSWDKYRPLYQLTKKIRWWRLGHLIS